MRSSVWVLAGLLLLTGRSSADGEADAVAVFRKLGGKVEADNSIINLSKTRTTNATLVHLKHLPNIQTLNLTGTEVTDEGLKELVPLQKLVAFYVSEKVTDAGLKELAALNGLSYVWLNDTQVTDAGLKELANIKKLNNVNLSGTRVTDAGLKELATLKPLQLLYLGRLTVTDAGVKELVTLEKLTLLDLRGTKVTDAGVAELQKALPKCKILKGRF
jgi:internalin A